MKKNIRLLLSVILIFILLLAFLNLNVTTRKGVNYQVQTIKIPLYLKVLDFFDRYYNYKWLVNRIVRKDSSEEERAMSILKWTNQNLVKQPQELNVVDDHVWHIIVRGYGTDDQFQDVFTTLCNYAGLNAFFCRTYAPLEKNLKWLSFVKIGQRWTVFDAYEAIYFVNKQGALAGISDFNSGDWQARQVLTDLPIQYRYVENLKYTETIKPDSRGLSRAGIQSPLRRFIFWVKNKIGK